MPLNVCDGVTVIPGTDVKCGLPRVFTGCNIVGDRCRCDQVQACPDDRPFIFRSAKECQMNLAVMLQHSHTFDEGKEL